MYVVLLLSLSSSSSNNNCWEGVNPSNCIINAKFHTISTYDVHIQCTMEESRDTGERFGKVFHVELNGCLSYRNTNPFEGLPNMNNLKKLTLNEFYIEALDLKDGPKLPKLEELILKDNVIKRYSSDFFAAEIVRQLKDIQFSGPRTLTPTLDKFQNITQLESLIIRDGIIHLDYELIGQLRHLNRLEIYSSNVTVSQTNSTHLDTIASIVLEDTLLLNSTVFSSLHPFTRVNSIKIKNVICNLESLNSIDLPSVLTRHPQLATFIVQNQNLTKLSMDLKELPKSQLRTLDISHNHLERIDWQWDSDSVKLLIQRNLKLLIDHNPWQCEFFQNVEEELFEYEKDYNAINVRGIKCKYNATWGPGGEVPHSTRPLDLNNIWLLYGCVLSSLLLIISITYLVFAVCRSKGGRREPFYRDLVKWKNPIRRQPDLSMRKLPATTYETPLQYRTIEFKSEDNCEIYEEIPAAHQATGQTLQVII